ncbi:MAG: hypothetical protein AAGI44_06620 [Pseudomonadota bacterium]
MHAGRIYVPTSRNLTDVGDYTIALANAKVEHVFGVMKGQLGFRQVRYKEL